MHIAEIDLNCAGDSIRAYAARRHARNGQADYARLSSNQEQAQLAINGQFFLPFPSSDPNAMLIGLAASNGNVYSSFEAPVQSYAIVTDAPALNIDPSNHASIVHDDTSFADGKHVQENVTLWNTVAGSAQIITNGMPEHSDVPRRHAP